MSYNVDTAYMTLTAAAASVNGADVATNDSGIGLIVYTNITAITGTTPSLVVTVQGKDPVSGVYHTILASASLTTAGFTVLRIGPGLATTANASANDLVPSIFRITATIAGTTPAVTATISITRLGIGR